MNSEVTVFEASGPIAMFRKPYTTTSSVSFAFPPPTAIAGMIAAIIGIPNGSSNEPSNAQYWPYMRRTRVAVRIMAEVKWKKHSLNFSNTKDPQDNPGSRSSTSLSVLLGIAFMLQGSWRSG